MPDAFRRAIKRTPENLAVAAHVLEIARAWDRGDLGLDSVRVQTGGRERLIGVAHTEGEDRATMMRLFDALVSSQEPDGSVVTHQGRLTREDLHTHRARVISDTRGRRVVQFPVWNKTDERLVYRPIPDHVIRDQDRREARERGDTPDDGH